MAQLVLLQGGKAVPYELDDPETTLGRHPECSVQIDSNMVSRRHACIRKDGEGYVLSDLGSGNGSFLNGQRVDTPATLKNNDRIKLGPVLFRFEQADPRKSNPLERTLPEATPGGALDLTEDDDAESTIMGALDSSGGFGMLSVRPEEKLRAVLEISRKLAGETDLQKLLPKILDTLFEIFPYADRGCILLQDENGRMVPAAQKHRRDDEDATVKISRTILKRVLTDKQGILSADAANDARFDASESISSLTIRSIMCVPLLNVEGDPMGVINIDTMNAFNQFTKEDVDLLQAVAGQAALSYESTRLLTSYLDKQKQDSEMEIARDVQKALLPMSLPSVDSYDFYASYDSAQAVGGDYYDTFQLPDNRIGISFGDVAGKGVPGALIMSRIATVVQSTLRYVHDVEAAVTGINNDMCSKMADGRFVTYVLAIIDLNTHEMTLVNAGHASPLIRKPDGSVDEFDDDTIGIPIGIMEDYPYEVVSRKIEPGEIVVITTDGVDEAMDPDSNLYTKERVVEFLKKTDGTAKEIGEKLLADVRLHANGRPQNDDITIMTFGRRSEG